MRKILVSLIGGQTIPNVLLIGELGPMDIYIFIHSNVTKKQAEYISAACNEIIIDEIFIEMEEYNLKNFNEDLNNKFSFKDSDIIIVNISGGTKIMSLGAYQYFTSKLSNNSVIYYCDGGKNQFRQIFPSIEKNVFEHKYEIPIDIYFKANGIIKNKNTFYTEDDIIRKNSCTKSRKLATNFFQKFSDRSDVMLINGCADIQQKGLRGKSLVLSDYPELMNSLENLNYEFSDPKKEILNKNETKYLTGDWFEEYVFFNIKELLFLDNRFSVLGLNSKREDASNEYDVLFTYKNDLYYIECKSTLFDIEGKFLTQVYNEALYKAAALRNEFGTFTKCFLFSSDDFSKLDQSHKSRAELLRVKLVGKEVISSNELLKNIFLNKN